MNLKKQLSVIFSVSLLLQSSLIFFVQPMIGKMLIPLVGGSAAVWSVMMAFFQINLLAGYGLARLTSELNEKKQAVFLIGLYIVAFISLPFSFDGNELTKSIVDDTLTFSLLKNLSFSIFLPFLALSMTAPTLQRLFTLSGHKNARDPYFLYAVSNTGSFIGLFSYPLIFEPISGLDSQLDIWVGVYAVTVMFIILCLSMIHIYGKTANNEKKSPVKKSKFMSMNERGKIIFLAAVPSSLMLGATTVISQELSPFPLLLIIPLAIYLVSFIYAFSAKRKLSSDYFLMKYAVAAVFTAVIMQTDILKYATAGSTQWVTILTIITVITAFTIAAFTCHTAIAESRPETDKLTEFYLFLSIGGAIGGCFNAFIVPFVFKDLTEFPLIITIGIFALSGTAGFRQKLPSYLEKKIKAVFAAAITVAILICVNGYTQQDAEIYRILTYVLIVLIFILFLNIRYLACAAVLFVAVTSPNNGNIYTIRNFFGITGITEMNLAGGTFRILKHGSTAHGFEIVGVPELVSAPVGYYNSEGPMKDITQAINPKRIAVFGLGSGAMSCLFKPEREITFYEIDPEMVEIAKEKFSFLNKCPPKDIIVGDARITFRNTQDDKPFDLLIIDAFSSDSIPTHLLTEEALTEYRKHLSPHGTILMHISNRYYNLTIPIFANAEKLGAFSKGIYFMPENVSDNPALSLYLPTVWAVIGWDKRIADSSYLQHWQILPYPEDSEKTRPWSDSYSNIIGNFFYTLLNGHSAKKHPYRHEYTKAAKNPA